MKKQVFFFSILAMCLGMANAQVSVESDGAVKIGNLKVANHLTGSSLDIAVEDIYVCPTRNSAASFTIYNNTPIVQSAGIGSLASTTAISWNKGWQQTYLAPVKAGGLILGTSSLPLGAVYTQSTNTISQTSTSDRRVKQNIIPLNTAMQGILSLNPVSFDYDYEKLFMNPEMATDKVGFIAQEVKEIFPKLVHYDSTIDLYTLDYVSLLPYLVKGFQEEHAANERLRQQVEDMQEMIDLLLEERMNEPATATPAPKNGKKNAPAAETDNAGKLSQNAPNPFSESTTIAYTLPAKAKASSLNIHSSTGKLVQTYILPTGEQKGTITVEGHTLTPGLYTYSLVVGGRVLDSKRMVVTE